MQQPIQITVRDLPHPDEIEALCRAESEKLESLHDRITSCRVVVSEPHRHTGGTHAYEILIDIRLPGGEIVVTHVSEPLATPAGIAPEVHRAFEKVRHRLKDFLEKRRKQTNPRGS